MVGLSSIEIFMYAGQAGSGLFDGKQSSMASNAERDEVYVLSLPAFVWFKANYNSVDPRIEHTCHVVGNQMLSVGGLNPSRASSSVAYTDTDPFWEGIKVFDMTALKWTNYFNANAGPYAPPQAIVNYYNGELKYPKWSQQEVEDLFLNSSSKNYVTVSSPSSSQKKITTRAVIGSVVGGLGSIVIGGYIAYTIFRKKRKKERERSTGKLPSIHETEERQVAGGLYEAETPEVFVEASGGERRILELNTEHPIPQEADSTALGSTFELQSALTHHHPHSSGRSHELDGPISPNFEQVQNELEGCNNDHFSQIRKDPVELESSLTAGPSRQEGHLVELEIPSRDGDPV